MRARCTVACVILALVLAEAAFAQVDVSGEWGGSPTPCDK